MLSVTDSGNSVVYSIPWMRLQLLLLLLMMMMMMSANVTSPVDIT